MLVFARRSLVPNLPNGALSLPAGRRALLLEGDWSDSDSECLLSLDSSIDASQFAHLDADAERLAGEIARAAAPTDFSGLLPTPNFADVNALRLRYEALRWLRIVAFWQSRVAERAEEEVDLYVTPGRDKEYAAVWRSLARACGFSLRIHFVLGDAPAAKQVTLPPNAGWRRLLARFCANRVVDRRRTSPAASAHRPRLLFVGNPRVLDSVGDAALDRGANVAWLYDRFAVGAWWRRRRDGVAWLTCDGDAEVAGMFPAKLLQTPVAYGDVDLSDAVETWYRRWREVFGPSQSRQWVRVGEHLASFRPSRIVLDEDATPLARITIAHAARLGIPSVVVQHGVCCVRFGFAPPAADTFCAWDEGTRRQLAAWNEPSERVVVTGSPHEPRLAPTDRRVGPRRIVLLATLPPRDDRPDAVEFHLTTRTYGLMLDAACTAVAELADAESIGIELIVKMHPRAPHDPLLAATLSRFPQLRSRVVTGGPLADVLASADVVLSCVSSSGIEAATAGLPVVQLLPQGSGNILPAEWYGLLGSARTLEELRPLLQTALETERRAVHADAPAGKARSAARIVDLLLAPHRTRRVGHTPLLAGPHFARRASDSLHEEPAHG